MQRRKVLFFCHHFWLLLFLVDFFLCPESNLSTCNIYILRDLNLMFSAQCSYQCTIYIYLCTVLIVIDANRCRNRSCFQCARFGLYLSQNRRKSLMMHGTSARDIYVAFDFSAFNDVIDHLVLAIIGCLLTITETPLTLENEENQINGKMVSYTFIRRTVRIRPL